VKQISSPDNEVFKILRDCLESKGIRKHGLFMVFGERAVLDTIKTHGALARNLLLCQGTHGVNDPIFKALTEVQSRQQQSPGAFSLLELAPALFNELDAFGTRAPILVLPTPNLALANTVAEPVGLEVICALSDPANVGALLRSAAAFGVERVIMLQEAASPFHPKAVRAASGTTLLTELQRGPSIRALSTITGPVAALDMFGSDLNQFAWPKNVRLMMGEEGQGLPADLKNKLLIKIPMRPNVESLNATVAASIALFSYRQRW
jgi:RNA methyltransferase, TrmH family